MATNELTTTAKGWRITMDCCADALPFIFGGTFLILMAGSGELLRPLAYAAVAAAVWFACCLHVEKEA